MFAKGLLYFSDISLSVTGLVVFVLVFLVILAQTYIDPRNKDKFQRLARFPIDEEQTHE